MWDDDSRLTIGCHGKFLLITLSLALSCAPLAPVVWRWYICSFLGYFRLPWSHSLARSHVESLGYTRVPSVTIWRRASWSVRYQDPRDIRDVASLSLYMLYPDAGFNESTVRDDPKLDVYARLPVWRSLRRECAGHSFPDKKVDLGRIDAGVHAVNQSVLWATA